MRRYETFVIMDPELSQDQRDQVIQRIEELITQMDGFLVFTDNWGERKLAYDIKKRARGYYVRFDYCGLSPLINEIARGFAKAYLVLGIPLLAASIVGMVTIHKKHAEQESKDKKKKK